MNNEVLTLRLGLDDRAMWEATLTYHPFFGSYPRTVSIAMLPTLDGENLCLRFIVDDDQNTACRRDFSTWKAALDWAKYILLPSRLRDMLLPGYVPPMDETDDDYEAVMRDPAWFSGRLKWEPRRGK